MERRAERLATWCGLLFVALVGLGLLEARLVPPPAATEGPARIADFYRVHASQLRLGMLLAAIGTGFGVPFIVALTRQLRRGSRETALLADIQLVSGAVVLVGILIPVVLIATAAFRPGRSPALIQLLNDVAFTMLLWSFMPATVEAAVVGFVVLADRSRSSMFPRWTGYFDIGVATIYVLGAPTLFVKKGAFGWDGVLAFWLVFIAFGLWVLVTLAMMLRASGRRQVDSLTGPDRRLIDS
jgi:hypothetical protein